MNQTYFCSYQDHEGEPITGYCLGKECESKSQCCMQCFKKKHDSHKKECKSLTQINAIILNQTQMICEIQQILQNHFEKLQKEELLLDYQNFNKNSFSVSKLTRIATQHKSYEEKQQINPKKEVQSIQQQVSIKSENKISEWQEEFDELMKSDENFILGMYSRRSGQLFESLKHFEQALIENPKKIVVYFYKGKALQGLNRFHDAMKCFDEAISIANKPNQAPLLNEKGCILQQQNKIEEAIKFYNQAIQADPKFINGYTNKGFALNLLNHFEEAIKCFEQAITVNPKCSLAYNNKGLSLFNLNKLNEALICFDQAISIDPYYTKALNSKGTVLDQLKKYEEALKRYDRVIQIDSNYFETYNNQGLTLANMEQFDQAIAHFQKAISIQPKYFHAYINLAYALTRVNRLDEALSCYKKAIDINPNNPTPYEKIGLTLYLLGKQKEAEKYFAEAKKRRGK